MHGTGGRSSPIQRSARVLVRAMGTENPKIMHGGEASCRTVISSRSKALFGWVGGGDFLRKKKTMCLVAIVLKLGSRDGAICNQIYEKVVCMKQLLTLQPNM